MVDIAQTQQNAAILVVDDNPLIVNVLRGLLGSENYRVFSCFNGEEALDLLAKKNIDVILCDVMMPRMDGYTLHQQVRQKAELAHIPFIFLTALDDQTEIQQGLESGADDYIVKPFNPRDLLALVRGKVIRAKSLLDLSEQRYDHFRKKVIHTLSHEFRTPLVAINTGTELLLDQQDNLGEQKIQNLLEAIQRGGQRLERLVSDFMLLQQIEAGVAERVFQSRAEKVVVGALVNNYLENEREQIEAQGFTLKFNDLSSRSCARIYLPQLYDVLGRLISNAIKFSPNQKLIEICLYNQDGEVVVEVRDRGLGFDVEKLRQAVDLFGQLDRDKLEQQGSGMGLAIANRYAAIAGGRLEFEARPDGGSLVGLVLPRVE